MTYIPRDYQERCLKAIRAAARRGKKRILVTGPTGSGKTLPIAMLMQSAQQKGKRSLFIADQHELVHQAQEKLGALGVRFGTIMAGAEYWRWAPAMVASKDTLWARAYRSKKIEKPQADICLVDEIHRNFGKVFNGMMEDYKDAFVIGFTATPIRNDGRGFGDFFEELIPLATYKELIERKLIVTSKIFAPVTPDLKGLKASSHDWTPEQLDERVNQARLVGDIVADWKQRGEGRITIAFATTRSHAVNIRNEFRRAGIHCEYLDGETEAHEREDIIGGLGDGKIQIVSNVGCLTTGVDLPIVKCAIMARPTKSLILWRQCLGRILRPYPGYDDAIVLDHSGSWERHGFPDDDVPWQLDTTERIKEVIAKQKKEKKIKDPYKCPQCKGIYRGPQCPYCGHRPGVKEKRVRMEKGSLHEVRRGDVRKATLEEKQKVWDDCLGVAIGRGMKVGAAAHMYRQRFNCWPEHRLKKVPRSDEWKLPAKEFYKKWRAKVDAALAFE